MASSLPTNGSPREDGQTTSKRTVKRMLNTPLLVGTLIAVAVLSPAAYAWHAFQVNRTAKAFLQRADRLEEEDDWAGAAGYLYRYLRLNPDAADVRVRLAKTFDQGAKDPRGKAQAVEFYYVALGLGHGEIDSDTDRDLRRRLAELLLELGPYQPVRFASAEMEAKKLEDKDSQGWRLLALALYGQVQSKTRLAKQAKPQAEPPGRAGSEWAEGTIGRAFERSGEAVDKALRRARKSSPGDIELAAALARVYRDHNEFLSGDLAKAQREQLADQVLAEMVAASPKNPEAYLARYRYRMQYELPQAKEDLQQALKYGPDNLAVLLSAAAHARREAAGAQADKKLLDEARKHYEHAIEVTPADERAYVGLGDVCLAQNEVDRTIEVWRRGLEEADKESLQLNSRLAEVLIAQGQLEQAEEVLNVFDGAIKTLGARLPRPARASLERSNDLLRAKWLVRKGDHVQAIPLLKRVAAGPKSVRSEVAQSLQAWLLLGGAYAASNQWDQAATAYQEAATLQPKVAQPRLAAATAWATAGRLEMAIRGYEQALALDDAPETWLALAYARLQTQLRLPRSDRNWDAFAKALAKAGNPASKRPLADPWRLKLLEAEYARVRGEEQGQKDEGIRKANELLREAEDAYPDSAGLFQRLVLLYEQLGSPADADRALEKFEQLTDKSVAAYLLRSGLCSRRKQYEEAREVLRVGLESLPTTAHPAIEYALAQLSLQEGDLKKTRQELEKLHEKSPSNVGLVRQIAQLVLEAGELKELQRWEKKLRGLEGPNGLYCQWFEAQRLLAQAKGPEDPDFVRAAELQAKIESQHPAQPAVHLLKAQIMERRGNPQEAISAYQEAIHSGERRISIYERLIELLYRTQRFAEADEYLLRLQDHVAASENLSSMGISVAARRGDLDRALEFAEQAVERRPEDPMAHIWLGHMLLANEKAAEAEAAFQQAVRLAPADVRAYNGLLTYYLRTKQPDRAKETLQELTQNAKLSEGQRAFVLAQGYELLGEQEKAEASYREAQRLAPDNVAVQRRLAAFLLRGDPVEGEKALRRLLEMAPQSGAARRTLAAVLAARGGEEQWAEAQRLLEESGADRNLSSLDRRLQAVLLARRGGKDNVKKARQILVELVADPKKAVAADRLLLARLYEAEGQLRAARQQYIALISRTDPDVSHLALYVDLLLRHEAYQEADRWLKRLEEAAPDNLGAVGLRVRWLDAQDRTSEIESLVEPVVKKLLEKLEEDDQKAQLFLSVGNLYSRVKLYPPAGDWYRRLADLVPERYEPLAMCLGRQGRMGDAIRICTDAAKSDNSPHPANTLASVLSSGKPTLEDFQLAEPLFAKALEDHKDNADLFFNLGNVRIVQKRAEDAIRLYEQAVELEPKHVLALNNLATLLSEQPGKGKEAQKHIDRAIEIVGPQPELLDTKGMVLVFDGRAKEAVQLLEAAASVPSADPRFPFHLAVAYARIDKIDKARDALKKARDGDLAGQILTQTDQKLLTELEQKLRQ